MSQPAAILAGLAIAAATFAAVIWALSRLGGHGEHTHRAVRGRLRAAARAGFTDPADTTDPDGSGFVAGLRPAGRFPCIADEPDEPDEPDDTGWWYMPPPPEPGAVVILTAHLHVTDTGEIPALLAAGDITGAVDVLAAKHMPVPEDPAVTA